MTDYSIDSYLEKLFKKFEFLSKIIITDTEGALILYKSSKNNNNDEGNSKSIDKLKGSLSFLMTSAFDQLFKTEKEKVKYLTSIYEEQVLVQSKIGQFLLIHVISNMENSSLSVIKMIIDELGVCFNNTNLEMVYQN